MHSSLISGDDRFAAVFGLDRSVVIAVTVQGAVVYHMNNDRSNLVLAAEIATARRETENINLYD